MRKLKIITALTEEILEAEVNAFLSAMPEIEILSTNYYEDEYKYRMVVIYESE